MEFIKSTFLVLIALAISPWATSHAAESKDHQAEAKNLDSLQANQKAFLNLPEETRKAFFQSYFEANRLFQQKRVLETLDQLAVAAKIFSDSPELCNLRGSCYVELRAFDKALIEFNKALSYANNNQSVLFNIGEVYFVTQKWQEAINAFEKLLKILPPQNTGLGRLAEFKILLCKNKLGLKNEVIVLAEKYGFMDDSPYYYYAQAALAFENKNLVKAEEWLARAQRIFNNSSITEAWQDTFIEYGYRKSFYGEDQSIQPK